MQSVRQFLNPASAKQLYQSARLAWLARNLGTRGDNLQLDSGVRLESAARIHLADGARLGRHALLRANTQREIRIGADTSVLEQCLLTANEGHIHIGARSWLGAGTYLYGNGNITIGNDVLIAARCSLNTVSHNHAALDQPINNQGINVAPIHIEDDVWIGLHAVILQGVTIGRGAIVGAGSLVNKDVPAYSIVAGTPARIVRSRSPIGSPINSPIGSPKKEACA
jgi:acetyltransferase-like isoleucine patch superfamily enzyme